MIFKDYPITAFTMDQKYRFKTQINLSGFLFRDLTLVFLLFSESTLRDLTIENNNITDFSLVNFLR